MTVWRIRVKFPASKGLNASAAAHGSFLRLAAEHTDAPLKRRIARGRLSTV
jgi:hypothetical protein